MMIFVLYFLASLVPCTYAIVYSLQDDYSANKFADMFSFDTEDDPTHGYVNYIDMNTAQSNGLFDTSNGKVTMRVDSTNVASGRGRDSIRVTSKTAYNHGLIVIDIAHMPGSICGTWPAFWTTGPDWPNNGEIDIIEGVNTQSGNKMTMHTGQGCSLLGKDCNADGGKQGCGTDPENSQSYGDGFNQNKGGIYALEWTSDALNIWFFPRGSEPKGILGDAPDPANWGQPTANFQGDSGCTIDDHFRDQNIVFDTTFCGDWAGKTWADDGCSSKGATCQDYVMNNPQDFAEAYWEVNALKVYSSDGSSGNSSHPSGQPSAPFPTEPSIQPTESAFPTTFGAGSQFPEPPSPTSFGGAPPSPSEDPGFPSQENTPVVTQYVDGGPVTQTSPAPMVTETAAPVVMTLPPGEKSPHQGWEHGQPPQDYGSGSWGPPPGSGSGRRKRNARRHLMRHQKAFGGYQHL
ncbi:MAG: hypothetical protein Q9214_001335 [Letrouitia sp. 1 TL-2023]